MSPTSFHPLDSLTPKEILAVSQAARLHAVQTLELRALKTLSISLIAPPKLLVLAYLGISTDKESKLAAPPAPSRAELGRKAECVVMDALGGGAFELTLASDGGLGVVWKVENVKKLAEGVQATITPDELCVRDLVRPPPTRAMRCSPRWLVASRQRRPAELMSGCASWLEMSVSSQRPLLPVPPRLTGFAGVEPENLYADGWSIG